MGFILPKLNFLLTRKIRENKEKYKQQNNNIQNYPTAFTSTERDVFKKFQNNKQQKYKFYR